MIYGAVLAGGVGLRMKTSDVPKQFLMLGSKPIIIHTVEKFLANNRFDYVYVGVNSNWILYFEDLIKKYNLPAKRLKIVAGGADRNLTIMNIIDDIHQNIGSSDEDIIVTHDAVRPFVTNSIINENIDAALEYGACDTVIPAHDTIVRSVDQEFISDIPNRSEMYLGQVPQSFKINHFEKLYKSLTDEQKSILTDACKVFVLTGEKVFLVEGEVYNIKITTMRDYLMAQAIMGGNIVD